MITFFEASHAVPLHIAKGCPKLRATINAEKIMRENCEAFWPRLAWRKAIRLADSLDL
jgi:hypothetical protein